jgi:small subunit ribosomal protein S8
MTATNVLSNLFASLQNAEMRNRKECLIIPASKLASEVLRVLQKRRYIGEFEFIDDGYLANSAFSSSER